MEEKKVKKLVIKKETIANLSKGEMAHQKGGDSWWGASCVGSALLLGACSCATGCDDCLILTNGLNCQAMTPYYSWQICAP